VSSDEEGNGKRFIHTYDFTRGTSTRVSTGGSEIFPVLSPDGRTVAYQGRDDQGSSHIYMMPAEGSGKSEAVPESTGTIVNDWSPDGRYLIYMSFQRPGPRLRLYDFQKHSHSEFASGVEGQFSPDGKWVAFTGAALRNYANADVFVAQFPAATGRIQISNHGGAQPHWRSDGKELFYINRDKKPMAVLIDAAGGKWLRARRMPCFKHESSPRELFCFNMPLRRKVNVS
jgi:Tol biopolymer transport system component